MSITLVLERGCVCAIAVADSPDALSLSISLTGILLAVSDTSLPRWNTWRRERSAGETPRGDGVRGRYRVGISVVSNENIGVGAW